MKLEETKINFVQIAKRQTSMSNRYLFSRDRERLLIKCDTKNVTITEAMATYALKRGGRVAIAEDKSGCKYLLIGKEDSFFAIGKSKGAFKFTSNSSVRSMLPYGTIWSADFVCIQNGNTVMRLTQLPAHEVTEIPSCK